MNEYLGAAGREGAFYREALGLLDSAEVRLQQEERAARWPAGSAFRDCEVCPEMVVLPGGALALGRYEVGGAAGGCQANSSRILAGPRLSTDGPAPGDLPELGRRSRVRVLAEPRKRRVLPSTERCRVGRAAAGSQPGCYFDRTGTASACPVNSYGPNPVGLSGMVSNLSEWTSDCWEGDCGSRVVRGGSWFKGAGVVGCPS